MAQTRSERSLLCSDVQKVQVPYGQVRFIVPQGGISAQTGLWDLWSPAGEASGSTGTSKPGCGNRWRFREPLFGVSKAMFQVALVVVLIGLDLARKPGTCGEGFGREPGFRTLRLRTCFTGSKKKAHANNGNADRIANTPRLIGMHPRIMEADDWRALKDKTLSFWGLARPGGFFLERSSFHSGLWAEGPPSLRKGSEGPFFNRPRLFVLLVR